MLACAHLLANLYLHLHFAFHQSKATLPMFALFKNTLCLQLVYTQT